MRNRRIINGVLTLAACVAVISLASGAKAGTRDGMFAVEAGGRTLCPAFVAARTAKSQDYFRYVGFIEGYLTAANRYEPNTFDLTPWHTTDAFALILEQHCRKNAKDSLAVAAQKLVIAMMPFRLAEFSKLMEVGQGAQKTRIYEVVLKRAQRELTSKGLYRGAIDGQYSPATQQAVQQFQRLAKLDPSGIPDTATLWVLLNP